MLKTPILFCALCFGATSPLSAAETIEVEKLSKAQLQEALQAAPDDAIIEYGGRPRPRPSGEPNGRRRTGRQTRRDQSDGGRPTS